MARETLTVVVKYQISDEEGGGSYLAGEAPEEGTELSHLVTYAVAGAEGLVRGFGYEWAAVRVGEGEFDEVDCDSSETVHVAAG